MVPVEVPSINTVTPIRVSPVFSSITVPRMVPFVPRAVVVPKDAASSNISKHKFFITVVLRNTLPGSDREGKPFSSKK